MEDKYKEEEEVKQLAYLRVAPEFTSVSVDEMKKEFKSRPHLDSRYFDTSIKDKNALKKLEELELVLKEDNYSRKIEGLHFTFIIRILENTICDRIYIGKCLNKLAEIFRRVYVNPFDAINIAKYVANYTESISLKSLLIFYSIFADTEIELDELIVFELYTAFIETVDEEEFGYLCSILSWYIESNEVINEDIDIGLVFSRCIDFTEYFVDISKLKDQDIIKSVFDLFIILIEKYEIEYERVLVNILNITFISELVDSVINDYNRQCILYIMNNLVAKNGCEMLAKYTDQVKKFLQYYIEKGDEKVYETLCPLALLLYKKDNDLYQEEINKIVEQISDNFLSNNEIIKDCLEKMKSFCK